MTSSLNTNKKVSVHKVHCITDRFFVILDDRLVELLNIDEQTWMEEERTEEGIVLKIRKLKSSEDS